MTIDCNNINLKKGSTGTKVKEVQTVLKSLGYYTGKLDGDYGDMTVSSVKSYQKKNGLLQDGIVGPITCKKLNTTNSETHNETTTQYSYYKNGIYHSGQHWTATGCNKKGQCNSYYCACCAIRQQLTKLGIEKYTQQNIASIAGTTTKGTGHPGISTAIATIARKEGVNLSVEWKNFSDLGSTQQAKFEALGKIIAQQNKAVILHTLYQNKYGHYESVQEINMNNRTSLILNSLGSKCNSPAYCGRNETRSWTELARNLAGISQPSICIITKK